MKKFKWLLCILLASGALFGCSGKNIELTTFYDNYQAYTKYLAPTEFEENDVSYWYKQKEDGTYHANLHNDNEDKYVICLYNLYESDFSEDPVSTIKTDLIRPTDLCQTNLSENQFGEYYEIANVTGYTFNYDASIEYDYLNDHDGFNDCIDIIIDGKYTLDDVKSIAQREYIIAVLTNYGCEYLYFFDDTHVQDEKYPEFPDFSSAVYIAKIDYNTKTINIIEGSNRKGDVIESITME